MKKDTLYILTLLAIALVVFFFGYLSMSYLLKVSTNEFLEIQIEGSKREAREFAKIVAFQIERGAERQEVIDIVQKSIEGTDIESGFICMFDWSGVEICHPNPKMIGQKISPDKSYVHPINDEMNSDDFYTLLTKKREEIGGIRDFSGSNRDSEIIYLYPVSNTDWIIAAHANMSKIEDHVKELKINFLLVYLLSSLIIILLSLVTVRYIGSYYEKQLELKNDLLSEEVINLSKLNLDLTKQKVKIDEKNQQDRTDQKEEAEDIQEVKLKNRILTYSKDKLNSVKTEEISFIRTEYTITTIYTLAGKKFTTNASLDELYLSLDPLIFFRANRQFILSIKGIKEILKYGNNQLKIITSPFSDIDIIINKNRVSEFKKWLNS